MNKLFIDLEVIAADNGNALDSAIANIDEKASKKYVEHILKLFLTREIKEEEYREFLEESYDCKDSILEELNDKYKGLIDYTTLYESNDSNKGIIDYVNKVSSLIKTYIIFYYNTEREQQEKEDVCKEYFPSCDVIAIKYYQKDYKKGIKRERTNKAQYIANKLGQNDLEECMLIDKSKLCCEEWGKLGGYSSLVCKTQNGNYNYNMGRQRG